MFNKFFKKSTWISPPAPTSEDRIQSLVDKRSRLQGRIKEITEGSQRDSAGKVSHLRSEVHQLTIKIRKYKGE